MYGHRRGDRNEIREQYAHEWMEGTYDINYTVDREKRYLGAEILVAGGGPTIWVNLNTREVEGYWGADRVTYPSMTTWDWTIIVKKCMATNWSMDRSALALLSSDQDRKPQASSGKHQAPRRKRQASSRKRQAPGSVNHGKVSSTSDQGPGQV